MYGLSDVQTKQLRLCSNMEGEKGRLKSQLINGEEWPEFMLEENGDIKAEFDKLDYPQGLRHVCGHVPEQRAKQLRKNIFAFGGPRNNLNPNVTALATLMLREHNRHASEIERSNPEWDDERVFQITRNLVTVLYLKVILEDYIGEHITAHDVTPRVDPNEKIWNAKWYKSNWMTAEFSILYRLHALIPDTIHWGDKDYSIMEQLFNNDLLLNESNMGGDLRKAFVNISNHRATAFTLKNTEKTYMANRDVRAVEMGRSVKLKPYVDYCEYMGEPRPKSFAEITSDESIQQALCDVYGTVDKVEFMVGLMAADHGSDSIWGMTMKKFIALDAFSQVFTHPLISKHVWARGEEAFTKYGFELIKSGPYRLKDIVEANTKSGEKLDEFIGMNNPAYVKESIFKGFCKP